MKLSPRTLILVATCAAAASVAAMPAAAQEHVELRNAVEAGDAHFEAGNYASAREEYLRAYTIRPEPILLYNVAQCYRNEGKLAEAKQYYERFLKTPAPDPLPRAMARSRDRARQHIRDIDEALHTATGTSSTPATTGPNDTDGEEPETTSPPTMDDSTPPAQISHAADPPVSREPADLGPTVRASRQRTGAWISFGVGGAALLAGGVFGTLGLSAESDKNANPTRENADRVERYETMANASYAIGVVALATGGVLYLLSRRSKPRDAAQAPGPTVTLYPLPEGAAASLRVSF